MQANPPRLHSNLKFVQLFRRETKLVSEVEYYLTNLISAKMFIINVNGNSLSMEESEFQEHMESAKLGTQTSAASHSSSQGLATSTRGLHKETDMEGRFVNIFSLSGAVCLSTYLCSSFTLLEVSIFFHGHNVFPSGPLG